MKKILFITNRNALTTCGALRLIKNRAEALYQDYNISTDFAVYQKQKRIDSPYREIISAGGEMEVFGYAPKTYYKNLSLFRRAVIDKLKTQSYDAIIISQIALFISIEDIRTVSKAPIYLDIHGAPDDIYGSVKMKSLHKYIYRRLIASYYIHCLRYYFKKVDGCLVVSKGLETYLQTRFKPKEKFLFFRAPCAIVSKLNEYDYKRYRDEYRKMFNLNEDELAFVYSGGLEPWQCIGETIRLYKAINQRVPLKTKMLIFSYEVEKAKELIGNDSSFILKSFKSDELEKALCACDYAFLLRKDITTNHVAFPNKFLEYVKSYLKVIATPYVYDVAAQIREHKLGAICDFCDDDKIVDYVIETKEQVISTDVINQVLEMNSFKTRLADFAAII